MTRNDEMRERLSEIRDYIASTVDDRGYPPTIREICTEFDIKSTSSASYYLRKLEEAGEVRINRQTSRGLEVTARPRITSKDVRPVSLIGSITAGAPKLAVEDSDETYYIPTELFHNATGDIFMLNVIGTSMIEIGINDGDKILVRSQPTARNGQVVVALVEDDCATVKRYFNENGRVRLHPENRYMDDIFPTELKILGIVVGLIRTEIN